MTVYLGEMVDTDVESICSITNSLVILAAKYWCDEYFEESQSYEIYLGAHMANDPNWKKEKEEEDSLLFSELLILKLKEEENETHTSVGSHFEFFATTKSKLEKILLINIIVFLIKQFYRIYIHYFTSQYRQVKKL